MAAKKPAIVLLSGGLDSATCLAIAEQEGFAPLALSFDYGQRHKVELEAARAIAESAGLREHVVATIDLRVFGGSALTADINVPKDRDIAYPDAKNTSARDERQHGRHGRATQPNTLDEQQHGRPFGRAQGRHGRATQPDSEIPITYVPARNTIFLSYALAFAETRDARDIFIGVNAVDYSGYPDCRGEYIRAFERMAALATRAGVEGAPARIYTPLIDLSKTEIIRRGFELGVDYGLTRSCYDPDARGRACGRCESCQLRLRAFERLGAADPAPYQSAAKVVPGFHM